MPPVEARLRSPSPSPWRRPRIWRSEGSFDAPFSVADPPAPPVAVACTVVAPEVLVAVDVAAAAPPVAAVAARVLPPAPPVAVAAPLTCSTPFIVVTATATPPTTPTVPLAPDPPAPPLATLAPDATALLVTLLVSSNDSPDLALPAAPATPPKL